MIFGMPRDDLDLKLLHRLQKDGRATWKELSELTGLSSSTVMERVRRLERSGVIQGFSATIDQGKAGLPVEALVTVVMEPHTRQGVADFSDALDKWASVVQAWHLTGSADFLLRVVAPDLQALETVLTEELCSLPHIRSIQTSIVLSTTKHPSPLPLPPPQANGKK